MCVQEIEYRDWPSAIVITKSCTLRVSTNYKCQEENNMACLKRPCYLFDRLCKGKVTAVALLLHII